MYEEKKTGNKDNNNKLGIYTHFYFYFFVFAFKIEYMGFFSCYYYGFYFTCLFINNSVHQFVLSYSLSVCVI